jgi:hypothetical protein
LSDRPAGGPGPESRVRDERGNVAGDSTMRLGRKRKGLTDEERLALLDRYSGDRSELRVEELPAAPAEQSTDLVEEYLAIVGLRAEDVVGIYPVAVGTRGRVGDVKGEETSLTLCIAYRDRPEYQAGRDRHREYLDELAAAGG